MPNAHSKFYKKGVDYIKSGKWVHPLGKTLEVTAEIAQLLGNFIPGVG